MTAPVEDGRITLYDQAGSVDLLADVEGYFTNTAGQGDRFKDVAPAAPARILNTVAGVGALKTKIDAGKIVNLQVAGRGGVPATGVSAIVVNVTVTNAIASTYVSAYPYGTPRPATSNVAAGRTVANQVVVPVRDGRATLYNHSGAAGLLADAAGYFTEWARSFGPQSRRCGAPFHDGMPALRRTAETSRLTTWRGISAPPAAAA
ncbi:hypothetical protein [Streptomyces sp. NPDC003943]